MVDITERKNQEDVIRQERAYFEQLIEGAPEAIVQTDGKYILRINNEFTKLFGYSKSEAIGQNIDLLITNKETLKTANSISKQITQGRKVLTEGIRYHKNGKPINVSILGTSPHFKSFEELQESVEIAHSRSVPVILTLNEHYYSKDQYPYLLSYVDKVPRRD